MKARNNSVLRITGGSLKGRTIPVPPGIIRPAMDKMRESVFGVLGDLSGCSFLDLFSGSGIIALEAASRGASRLEAVEADRQKLKTLIANTSLSPVRIHCRLLPVELFIQRAASPYNFIFCDPPFAYHYKNDLVARIGSSCIMNGNSLLMIHHQKKESLNLQANQISLKLQDSRIYGNSIVDFFVKNIEI